MWCFRSKALPRNRGLRFTVDVHSRPATFADVLRSWRNDAAFRSMFSTQLANTPYRAFRWETPPVTDSTVFRPFEFVLLDSPDLARHPEPDAFARHLGDPPESRIVVFPNLGGDAILVVPCPVASPLVYGHLAAFVRKAPESQRHALWQSVSEAMARRVGPKPVWLSTAGGGVAWLHVRLDDRPKYYRFGSYRDDAGKS